MSDKYLTVQEVAEELGVVPESVRRYIREKKLPAKKVRIIGMKEVWGVDPKDLTQFKNG